MFRLEEKENLFSWDELGDIEVGRPNLGLTVPVSQYRLLQYAIRHVLSMEFDRDFADRILYQAGKLVGGKFCREMLNVELDPAGFFQN
ncbi:MAG: hypothetical protein ACOX6S_08630 [Clostridia bacterium]|jgi:hypothetical protein